MGKNKPTRAQISEAVDPRFMGTFKRSAESVGNKESSSSVGNKESSSSVGNKESSSENKSHLNEETTENMDEDERFREYLSKKLFEFVECQIKDVKDPDEVLDVYFFNMTKVSLLHGSEVISEFDAFLSSENSPPNKKMKTDN